MQRCLLAFYLSVLVLDVGKAAKSIIFDDGLTHTIEAALLWIHTYDRAGSTTTLLHLEDRATVIDRRDSYDSSVLNVRRAQILKSTRLLDNSALNIAGVGTLHSTAIVDRLLHASSNSSPLAPPLNAR
jgi:hypothetical protein